MSDLPPPPFSTSITVDPSIINQLTDRAMVSKDQFLTLPDELRMRAFTIAKQTEANILQQTLDALRQTIEQGGTLWNFRENFPDLVAPYTEAGRDWHLTQVFQENVRQARAVGAYQARQKVKRAFPYVEYRTGPNPRPAHAALDGLIFDIDDPFLLTHTPPWDFNCNCDLNPRTAAQVGIVAQEDASANPEDQRVVSQSPALQRMLERNKLPDPVSGAIHPVDMRTPTQKGGEYSFRPDRLNQPLDVSGYDPAIRDRLLQQLAPLGYRLSADGLTAIPGDIPLPPSLSAQKHLARPAPSKIAMSALRAGHASEFAVGRPVSRVSRPAPQIASRNAHVSRPKKEAA